MTPTIGAIDTEWNNQFFRSRLEARWAVFYDSLSIPYQYEPQSFKVGATVYIPDFYLSDQDCWIEIKPKFPSSEEVRKLRALACIVKVPVFCFFESPRLPEFGRSDSALYYCWIEHPDGQYDIGEDNGYYWCECPRCGRLDIQFNGRADRIKCGCPKSPHGDKGYNFDSERLTKAYRNAAFSRFGAYE